MGILSDRRIYGPRGSGQYRYEIDGREVTKAEFYADRVPAVAPDNDPEDTIARFNGLHVSMPPFPGYQSRKTVEEQYDPADDGVSIALKTAFALAWTAFGFFIGVLVTA